MANSLGERLEVGTVVILRDDIFPDIKDLRFRVSSGFGLSHETRGSALFGTFLEDDEEARVEGYDIDPKATKEYWLEFGRDGEGVKDE